MNLFFFFFQKSTTFIISYLNERMQNGNVNNELSTKEDI